MCLILIILIYYICQNKKSQEKIEILFEIYKIVWYNGDIPRAEIGRCEVWAYKAQVDVNEKALTSYVAEVSVDDVDNTKINIKDGDAIAKFEKLIDVLKDLDDVQQVYHNVELPDEE